MNIPKAIKDMKARIDWEQEYNPSDKCEDMLLSIEAMEHYKKEKQEGSLFKAFLLPGETEE